jgi:hypothetical protein
MHAAVQAPSAMVGLDPQVYPQMHFQVRFARANLFGSKILHFFANCGNLFLIKIVYLSTLAAYPLGLVQMNGAYVVIQVGKVCEYLIAVLANGDVFFFVVDAVEHHRAIISASHRLTRIASRRVHELHHLRRCQAAILIQVQLLTGKCVVIAMDLVHGAEIVHSTDARIVVIICSDTLVRIGRVRIKWIFKVFQCVPLDVHFNR